MDSSSTTTNSKSSSELFICFNSRLSTKISAKPSILSPARDPQISLSACRSRRLRTSGSIRNGVGRSSPMFAATGGRKKGSGFDNPEPSSPKVTCIGQVRVKSKKKGIKMRAMPRRQSGEISFRTLDQIQRQSSYNSQYQIQQHRNQRWVHLPLSICESFNCLIPCKNPCENGRVEKKENQMVVMVGKRDDYDKNEEKLEEEEDEEEEEMEMPIRSTRRHVFDKIEIEDELFQVKDDNEEEKNVPIPPKNALLLMRCRYDPLQMEALANRCSEPQSPEKLEDEEEEEEKSERTKQVSVSLEEVKVQNVVQVSETEEFKVSETENLLVSLDVISEKQNEVAAKSLPRNEKEEIETQALSSNEETEYKQQENQEEETEEEESEVNIVDVLEVLVDEESEEDDEIDPKHEDESRVSYSNASFSLQSDDDIIETDEESEEQEESETVNSSPEIINQIKILDHNEEKIRAEEDEKLPAKTEHKVEERENVVERESRKLPECLLLMMCEPKLSMEVSRETWVYSTDFIYQSPEKKKPPPEKPPDAGNEESDNTINYNPVIQQNLVHPRSSSTFPATANMASMAAMIEQKLLNTTAYEPFVLTRCKSAPIRTAAHKVTPDGWLWKNSGLEPHRIWKNGGFEPHQRGNYGIGAAGVVGFSR